MKFSRNLLIVTLAFFGVIVFAIWWLAPPCEGSYGLSFGASQSKGSGFVNFKCEIPQVSQRDKEIISEQAINDVPSFQSQSTSVASASSLSCSQVRGSLTLRRKLGNSEVADTVCKSIVRSLPANYLSKPDLYRLQSDGSVTFNTGSKHDDQEVWCNCHP